MIDGLSRLVEYKIPKEMNVRNKYWRQLLMLFGAVWMTVIITGIANAQGCPTFRIKEVKNSSASESGLVIITINSANQYSEANFQIRQKENEVTGPLGYEPQISISTREIIISGLKKSEEMYLKEYVILFSDPGCDNSQIKEVGTFQIK